MESPNSQGRDNHLASPMDLIWGLPLITAHRAEASLPVIGDNDMGSSSWALCGYLSSLACFWGSAGLGEKHRTAVRLVLVVFL